MQRYRFTSGNSKGQFANSDQVRALTGRAIDEMRELAKQSNDLLFAGKITVSQWEKDIAYAIKQNSVWQYGLGIGGVGRLSNRDYGIIGREMRFQLTKLRGFSGDILDGKLTEAQINARLDLYFNRGYGMFERGRYEGHKANGYLWEKRILAIAEHCPSCLRYASIGWTEIGNLPHIGQQCECKANDRCSKTYSTSISRPV